MKYKQLLPIPDKYTVLLPCEDGYVDLEKEGWAVPFLVLAEDAGKNIIGVYAIDGIGDGQFETDFRLALRRPDRKFRTLKALIEARIKKVKEGEL